MNNRAVYLDANASEPLRPLARRAMLEALEQAGNPASVHQPGRAARRILETARESLAACFGAEPRNVVFTSGGTESDALGLFALGRGRRVIIGATEHDAVRAAAPEAVIAPVQPSGVIDLAALERLLAQGPALLALMAANNETGVLHPMAEVSRLCRAHGALLHVDAIQAAGRIPIAFNELGAASMAISSHKFGGPAGCGALFLSEEAVELFRPLIAGGGQERGRRGGTPPVAAIAGFAAAAKEATRAQRDLAPLHEAIERAAVREGAIVMGAAAPRLANTSSLALPGVRAETQVIALDLAGIAVSAGAACSSGKVAASHVLAAMGAGALAGEAIRVSLSWSTTEADVQHFALGYAEMVKHLLRRAA